MFFNEPKVFDTSPLMYYLEPLYIHIHDCGMEFKCSHVISLVRHMLPNELYQIEED